MSIRHPFERIPSAARRRVLLPSLAGALVVLAAWVITVAPMSTEEAPLSVSSFGTAWSLGRAQEMMASWDERARLSGAFGIGFDFLNLVVYSTAIGMACAWVAQGWREAGRMALANVWALMAWGLWLAVLCGTVQNAVMMSLLLGSGSEGWLKVSYWATLMKLALLILGPAFALAGWAAQAAAGGRDQARRAPAGVRPGPS